MGKTKDDIWSKFGQSYQQSDAKLSYCKFLIVESPQHGIQSSISGCNISMLTSKRSPYTRKRIPLVAALKDLIALTVLATLTALLTRISSTRKWWTRVTSSIEVTSDCCIMQYDIIRYYMELYHAVCAGFQLYRAIAGMTFGYFLLALTISWSQLLARVWSDPNLCGLIVGILLSIRFLPVRNCEPHGPSFHVSKNRGEKKSLWSFRYKTSLHLDS